MVVKRLSTLLLILLSYNLGYSYFSLDPNILEYGNLKFNKTLSGSDDVVSDSAVVLNEGDVMIILRFASNRGNASFVSANGSNSTSRGGLYVYTKNLMDDEILTPVNTRINMNDLVGSSGNAPSAEQLSEYLEGTYIVGPKLVYIAFPQILSDTPFINFGATAINCEMDYAIQRKRTVNPQPVSQ